MVVQHVPLCLDPSLHPTQRRWHCLALTSPPRSHILGNQRLVQTVPYCPDSSTCPVQEMAPLGAEAAAPQPSWANSPASPAVAVLEERAKAWSLAQRFGSSVDLHEEQVSPEPPHKRLRRQ